MLHRTRRILFRSNTSHRGGVAVSLSMLNHQACITSEAAYLALTGWCHAIETAMHTEVIGCDVPKDLPVPVEAETKTKQGATRIRTRIQNNTSGFYRSYMIPVVQWELAT